MIFMALQSRRLAVPEREMQTAGEGHYSGMQELQQLVLEKGPPVIPSSQQFRMFSMDALSSHLQNAVLRPRLHTQPPTSHIPQCIPFSLVPHFQHTVHEHLQLSLGDDSAKNHPPFAANGNAIRDEEDQIATMEHGGEKKSSNEWTPEETLALVRIRSEPDLDLAGSAPWEAASRKMYEIGYRKSPAACRQKCEELCLRPYPEKSCMQFNELEAVYSSTANKSISCVPVTSLPSEASLPEDSAANAEKYSPQSPQRKIKKKKKRKSLQMAAIRTYFERIVNQLLENQEALHNRFLDIIERREKERQQREELWKRQEMERVARESKLRVQERALASAREAAILNFLQKITGQTLVLPEAQMPQEQLYHSSADKEFSDPNCKRWPKPEVQALIRLRSKLEPKFQESGPKGSLWQEISEGMSALGFTNRSAKRCKEKWENINKYFRKTKDSLKKRPENAKTCPYFHQLDILYSKGILSSPSKPSKLDQSQEYCSSEQLTPENNNNGHLYYFTSSDAVDKTTHCKQENNEELASPDRTDTRESICGSGVFKSSVTEQEDERKEFSEDFQNKNNEMNTVTSSTQSALMALVDKLTSEIAAAEYAVSATSSGFV